MEHKDICGNCKWAVLNEAAKQFDVSTEQYYCHYNPPTVHITPIQTQSGIAANATAVRPMVKHDDLACCHFGLPLTLGH